MKKQTSNNTKTKPERESAMAEDKKTDLLEKTCQKMAETASETIELYEKYLLDEATWRDLAKNMTKLRSAISGYYAAGGK
jgi:hypothetical protein